MAADALDIVTLDEARDFLRFELTDTSNDFQLEGFISGITAVVEGEVGPVVAREVTALIYPATGPTASLPQWPVVSLTSGELLRDESVVDVSAMVSDRGVLFTKDSSPLPSETWQLTYIVGLDSVPQNIKNAALEILKTAWATQRGSDAPAFLIPYRAAAWLKSDTISLGFA